MINVGKQAAAEQLAMKYRDLTAVLIGLHEQALEVHDTDEQMFTELKIKMAEQLGVALVDNGNPDAVFSFIMYLVTVIHDKAKKDLEVGVHLNGISNAVNDIAASMGMEPLYKERPVDAGQYVTGTGQQLLNVHPQASCKGWCVIHNPLPGPWDTWPTNWRDARDEPFGIWTGFERVCIHGMGHTAAEEILRGNDHAHGCCGLCPCTPSAARTGGEDESQDQHRNGG